MRHYSELCALYQSVQPGRTTPNTRPPLRNKNFANQCGWSYYFNQRNTYSCAMYQDMVVGPWSKNAWEMLWAVSQHWIANPCLLGSCSGENFFLQQLVEAKNREEEPPKPLRFLQKIEKPIPRPPTPSVPGTSQEEEDKELAIIHLQQIIRGRAIQNMVTKYTHPYKL